jgi:endonuclease I
MPRKFIHDSLSRTGGSAWTLSRAQMDVHNLQRCCAKGNRLKGTRMLSVRDMDGEFSGIVARTYLYMNWRYQLGVDQCTLSTWKSLSLYVHPSLYERQRARSIAHYTGQANWFVDLFPLTVAAEAVPERD